MGEGILDTLNHVLDSKVFTQKQDSDWFLAVAKEVAHERNISLITTLYELDKAFAS